MKKIKIIRKLLCLVLSVCIVGTSGSYQINAYETNCDMNTIDDCIGKKSFYMGREDNTNQEGEITEENYFEVDNETVEVALGDCETDSDDDMTIDSLDELYGDKIDEELIEKVAKIHIASELEIDIKDFSKIEEISIYSKTLLYDANDINTYIGFNFFVNSGEYGYITVSTHTRAPLVREYKENVLLPKDCEKIYYFSEGEFYIYCNNCYKTLQNVCVSIRDFNELKMNRVLGYNKFTKSLLASLELDTINVLNNVIYLTTEIELSQELSFGKTYEGQDGSGYGGIISPKAYLKDRYGGSISLSSSKTLSMNSFICGDFEEKNNCTLVAITRILKYYNGKGYTKIPSNNTDIYKKVLKVAKDYGYTEKNGTFPTKINNIIDQVLDDYGYEKSYSKGIYLWTFNGQVKSEIDKSRPVVMNIARGYYGDHSVTVCGYAIYKSKHKLIIGSYNKTHNMICVYDGWSREYRYIDYEAFAYDLISSGFGSFNTVIMKK